MATKGKPGWKDEYFTDSYELARAGMSDSKISECLGVNNSTFERWKSAKPGLKYALMKARSSPGTRKGPTFSDYVYNRLPPKLQKLWDNIMACETIPNGIERVETLLQQGGKTTRQHLFLYALVHSSFNQSEACRIINISTKTLNNWIVGDPDFKELLDDIHWHKKNFFESALVDRVKDGDSACTIFANKTLNQDRFPSEKRTLEIESVVQHQHSFQIDMDKLNLSALCMREILDAMRSYKEDQKPKALAYIEAEIVKEVAPKEESINGINL